MFAAVHTGQPHCQREHDRPKINRSVKVVTTLERAFDLDTCIICLFLSEDGEFCTDWGMCNSSLSHGGASARNRQRLKISIPSLCSHLKKSSCSSTLREGTRHREATPWSTEERVWNGRGFTELQAPISSSAKARVRDDSGMWAGVRDDSASAR